MADYELLPVARCCACGVIKVLRNVFMLDKRAPAAGTGWGCVVCRLPFDGAIAIVCDDCLKADEPLMFVCLGPVAGQERFPIRDLSPAPFGHVLALHPEVAMH